MAEIHIFECTEAELATVETDLRFKGFHLVNKSSDKDLLPSEYIKTLSQDGERKWIIRLRVK